MSSAVLDASALLALLHGETGSERVAVALREGAAMSAVNFSEVLAKLVEAGVPPGLARDRLDALRIEVIAFDAALAYTAALLRVPTRPLGLSLADRACLATAHARTLSALTADRSWAAIADGPTIEVIR